MAYDGFISYSHAADGQLAPALQRGLQQLAKPWHRRRALRVFRDETGLSTNPHLWSAIASALDDSSWFVLLASPEAAASDWVNREVREWLATKPAARILPVVTGGEWRWDEPTSALAGDAVPVLLRQTFAEEPRHLDLRWARDDTDLDLNHPRFRDAIADLAAPMHGVSKDDIEGEDVRQHRHARRLARGAVSALALLLVMALAFGAIAISQRSQAVDQRDRADQQARLADARRLASLATSGASNDLARSALLAIEGNRLVNDSETRGAILSVAEDAAPVREIIHGSWDAAALSPDGRTVATVGSQGISLIDLRTERLRLIDREGFDDVRSVSFSPNGEFLALGRTDAVDIRDARTGAQVRPMLLIRGAGAQRTFVAHVHFSTDGSLVAAIDNFGNGGVWSVADGAQLAPIDVDYFGNGSSNVVFSPDGRSLAVTDVGDGLVGAVINAQSFPAHHLVRRYPSTANTEFGDFDVAFSPDGTRLASATNTGTILFRTTATGAIVGPAIASRSGAVSELAFSPDGRSIAGTATDGTVSVWDAHSGQLLDDALPGATRTPLALAFTPSGALVILTAAEIVEIDPSAQLGREIAPPADPALWDNETLAVAADGSSFAVGDSLGRVREWSESAAKLEGTLDATTPSGRGAVALAYRPGTHEIVVGTGSGTLEAWDLVSRRQQARAIRLTAANASAGITPGLGVLGASFDTSGGTLAAATGDGRVAVIDPTRWTVRRSFRLFDGDIDPTGNPIALSADGKTVALAGPRTVEIADIDGSNERHLDVGAFDTTSIAFTPNGRLLAVGLEDGRVLLVDPTTATVSASIIANHGNVDMLAFNSSGTALAIGGSDATVTLWDLAARQPIGPPLAFPGSSAIVGLAFSPASEQLFAAADNGASVRYDLDTGVQIDRLCSVIGRNLTPAERVAYLGNAAAGRQTCSNLPVSR
ncbi:MAG TPA: TIR domain-containing protein [Acidimicrobiia bacterium]|jgi:WD40 repeat protein